MRGYVKAGIGLFIGLLFLLVFLKFVGPNEIIGVLKNTNPFYVLLALIFSLAMILMRGRIWQENLQKIGNNMSLRKCIEALYSSIFVSSFFAGGQPITAYLMSKNNEGKAEENLAAMLGQDMLHWVASYFLISIGVIYYVFAHPTSYLNPIMLTGLIISGIVIVASIYVVWKKETWIDHMAIMAGDIVYRIRTLFKGESVRWKKHIEKKFECEVEDLEKALHTIFTSKRYTLKLVIYSILDRFALSMISYSLLVAVGANVPLFLVFLINSLSSLFRFLPLPGGVGPIEIGMTTIMVFLFGLSLPVAASVVLLYRVIQYWIPLLLGGVSLWLLTGGSLIKGLNIKNIRVR